MYHNPETKQNRMCRKALVSLSEMFTKNKLGSGGVLVKSEKCLRLVEAFQVWNDIFVWSLHDEKCFFYKRLEVWSSCCLISLMIPVKEKVHKKQLTNEQLFAFCFVLAKIKIR